MAESRKSSRIVEAAQSQRDLLGAFRDSAILDVAAFLRHSHGVEVVEAQGWEDGLSAITVRRPGAGRTVIGVNATHNVGRRNFSLAHELGHLLLHRNGSGARPVRPLAWALEREADLFALEFLIPERLLRAWCDAYATRRPERIARRICLSRSVVQQRLWECGLAAPGSAGRL